MFLGTPLVQRQQDRSIGVDDLAEIAVRGALRPLAEEPLVPLKLSATLRTPMIVQRRFN
jgi:hypothetical protein